MVLALKVYTATFPPEPNSSHWNRLSRHSQPPAFRPSPIRNNVILFFLCMTVPCIFPFFLASFVSCTRIGFSSWSALGPLRPAHRTVILLTWNGRPCLLSCLRSPRFPRRCLDNATARMPHACKSWGRDPQRQLGLITTDVTSKHATDHKNRQQASRSTSNLTSVRA